MISRSAPDSTWRTSSDSEVLASSMSTMWGMGVSLVKVGQR
jgi:hypothetical protein